jgi:phosphate starvation-inducible membrane PsiE
VSKNECRKFAVAEEQSMHVGLKTVKKLSTKVEIGQKTIPLGKHSVSDLVLFFFNLHFMPFASQYPRTGPHFNLRTLLSLPKSISYGIDRRLYIFVQDKGNSAMLSEGSIA